MVFTPDVTFIVLPIFHAKGLMAGTSVHCNYYLCTLRITRQPYASLPGKHESGPQITRKLEDMARVKRSVSVIGILLIRSD